MSNVIKFQAPFERLKLYEISPEVTLYKAIITQALIDATNISESKAAKKIEMEAKEWIFSNSKHFQEICLLAKLEPSLVINVSKELIAIHKENQHKLDKSKIVLPKRKCQHKMQQLLEKINLNTCNMPDFA